MVIMLECNNNNVSGLPCSKMALYITLFGSHLLFAFANYENGHNDVFSNLEHTHV